MWAVTANGIRSKTYSEKLIILKSLNMFSINLPLFLENDIETRVVLVLQ